MILFFALCLLVLFILLSWINLIRDTWKLSNIPGPFPLPIVGNGHMFVGDSKNWRHHGSPWEAANATIYLNSDISMCFLQALTSSKELITKGRSYTFLKPWLGNGLLTASGQRWKTHRKFLTPAFHYDILQNFLPVFLRNEKILVQNLRKVADGGPVDLFPIVALLVFDNMSETIMGLSVNAQRQIDSQSEYVEAIDKLSEITMTRMLNPFLTQDVIFNLLPHKKMQDKALKILHDQSKRIVGARRQELANLNITSLNYDSEYGIKNKRPFLDLLLLADIDGKKMDDVKVHEEVNTFMFEGHDAATSGITFCLYCIAKYKNVQEKILEEQKFIFGEKLDRDPSYSELQQMKYLDMVIKESLRIYPAVPLIERAITRDSDLAGLFVPKGTSVIMSTILMQRDPKVYDDPLEFRPERFETPSKNPFTWLAFSAGPRNCIGQKFAMMEMKVTISSIVRNFVLSPGGPEPLLSFDLVLRSLNGVHVKLRQRY